MSISSEDRALISAALEDRLDADERAAFWQRIATDAAFADAFAAATLLEADLFETQSPTAQSKRTHKPDDEHQRVVGISDASAQSKIKNQKSKISSPIPFIIYPISIAAAALLTAAIVVVYLLAFNADPQPDPIKPNQPGPAVATLIEVSGGGDLQTPHGYPAEGDDYSSGEYALTTGKAEFMLTNAVNVQLKGDTRLYMRNDMNVSLTRGSAAFVVPKDATGFTVHLPDGSRVVDLGTAFRVRVDDDGRYRVVVTDGEVEYIAAGETAVRSKLIAGQSAAVDTRSGSLTVLDELAYTYQWSPETLQRRIVYGIIDEHVESDDDPANNVVLNDGLVSPEGVPGWEKGERGLIVVGNASVTLDLIEPATIHAIIVRYNVWEAASAVDPASLIVTIDGQEVQNFTDFPTPGVDLNGAARVVEIPIGVHQGRSIRLDFTQSIAPFAGHPGVIPFSEIEIVGRPLPAEPSHPEPTSVSPKQLGPDDRPSGDPSRPGE